MIRVLALCSLALMPLPAAAQETPEPPMTMQRLGEIVLALDPEARVSLNSIEMTVSDIPVLVVADPVADRMRAMVPIRSADGLEAEELLRLMQANFDSALDARYAIAQGVLWSTFIHPLSSLEDAEFISAVAQTVTLAHSYGGSYSSGGLTFGGDDSNKLIEREIYERILRQGNVT